jgi:hypothetical protein
MAKLTRRRRRMLTRSIKHWIREARASKGYARKRAWGSAAAIAEDHPDWRVAPAARHQIRLVHIEALGPRGGIVGATTYYLTRDPAQY